MSGNPFFAYAVDGKDYFYVGADDRIRAVHGFDAAACEAALDVPGLQKTVRAAVMAHLRRLQRSGCHAPARFVAAASAATAQPPTP